MRRKGEVGCSTIFEKATKREEMEARYNSIILKLIILIRSLSGDELQKSGGKDVFAGGGRSRKTVAYTEAPCLG